LGERFFVKHVDWRLIDGNYPGNDEISYEKVTPWVKKVTSQNN